MQTRDAGWTGTGKSMVCWTKKGTKRRKVKEKEGKARRGGRREAMGEKGESEGREREREREEGARAGVRRRKRTPPCPWYVGETSRKNRNCKMCNCEFCPRLDEREDCRRRQRKVHPNRPGFPTLSPFVDLVQAWVRKGLRGEDRSSSWSIDSARARRFAENTRGNCRGKFPVAWLVGGWDFRADRWEVWVRGVIRRA